MTIVINSANTSIELQNLISGLTVGTETTSNLVLILKTATLANVDSETIKTELLNRLNSANTSTEIEEISLLCSALPLISENRSINVSDLTELNSLSVEFGTVVFVDSEGIPYIYKSNSTWTPIFANLQGVKPVNNALAWGANNYGKLGDGTTTSKSSPITVAGGFTDWIQVSTGQDHSLGLKANGTAWAWGRNSDGQLGDDTTVSKRSPVSVVGGFTDWIQISSGSFHSAGLRTNGSIWCWGQNFSGQLGNNSTTGSSSPVSAISGTFNDWVQVSAAKIGIFTLGLKASGTAWAWGRNLQGQLGDNSTTNRSSPVSVVGGFTDWIQLSAGNDHSLGLRADGTAWGWGNGGYGKIGNNSIFGGSSPVSVVGGFTDWIQLSAGVNHSLGLKSDGTAWAWGRNNFGELGDNSTTDQSSPISVIGGYTDWVKLESSNYFSLGLRSNGTAWAWGRNNFGQLGDNSTANKSSPVSVIGDYTDWIDISGSLNHTLGVRGG